MLLNFIYIIQLILSFLFRFYILIISFKSKSSENSNYIFLRFEKILTARTNLSTKKKKNVKGLRGIRKRKRRFILHFRRHFRSRKQLLKKRKFFLNARFRYISLFNSIYQIEKFRKVKKFRKKFSKINRKFKYSFLSKRNSITKVKFFKSIIIKKPFNPYLKSKIFVSYPVLNIMNFIHVNNFLLINKIRTTFLAKRFYRRIRFKHDLKRIFLLRSNFKTISYLLTILTKTKHRKLPRFNILYKQFNNTKYTYKNFTKKALKFSKIYKFRTILKYDIKKGVKIVSLKTTSFPFKKKKLMSLKKKRLWFLKKKKYFKSINFKPFTPILNIKRYRSLFFSSKLKRSFNLFWTRLFSKNFFFKLYVSKKWFIDAKQNKLKFIFNRKKKRVKFSVLSKRKFILFLNLFSKIINISFKFVNLNIFFFVKYFLQLKYFYFFLLKYKTLKNNRIKVLYSFFFLKQKLYNFKNFFFKKYWYTKYNKFPVRSFNNSFFSVFLNNSDNRFNRTFNVFFKNVFLKKKDTIINLKRNNFRYNIFKLISNQNLTNNVKYIPLRRSSKPYFANSIVINSLKTTKYNRALLKILFKRRLSVLIFRDYYFKYFLFSYFYKKDLNNFINKISFFFKKAKLHKPLFFRTFLFFRLRFWRYLVRYSVAKVFSRSILKLLRIFRNTSYFIKMRKKKRVKRLRKRFRKVLKNWRKLKRKLKKRLRRRNVYFRYFKRVLESLYYKIYVFNNFFMFSLIKTRPSSFNSYFNFNKLMRFNFLLRFYMLFYLKKRMKSFYKTFYRAFFIKYFYRFKLIKDYKFFVKTVLHRRFQKRKVFYRLRKRLKENKILLKKKYKKNLRRKYRLYKLSSYEILNRKSKYRLNIVYFRNHSKIFNHKVKQLYNTFLIEKIDVFNESSFFNLKAKLFYGNFVINKRHNQYSSTLNNSKYLLFKRSVYNFFKSFKLSSNVRYSFTDNNLDKINYFDIIDRLDKEIPFDDFCFHDNNLQTLRVKGFYMAQPFSLPLLSILNSETSILKKKTIRLGKSLKSYNVISKTLKTNENAMASQGKLKVDFWNYVLKSDKNVSPNLRVIKSLLYSTVSKYYNYENTHEFLLKKKNFASVLTLLYYEQQYYNNNKFDLFTILPKFSNVRGFNPQFILNFENRFKSKSKTKEYSSFFPFFDPKALDNDEFAYSASDKAYSDNYYSQMEIFKLFSWNFNSSLLPILSNSNSMHKMSDLKKKKPKTFFFNFDLLNYRQNYDMLKKNLKTTKTKREKTHNPMDLKFNNQFENYVLKRNLLHSFFFLPDVLTFLCFLVFKLHYYFYTIKIFFVLNFYKLFFKLENIFNLYNRIFLKSSKKKSNENLFRIVDLMFSLLQQSYLTKIDYKVLKGKSVKLEMLVLDLINEKEMQPKEILFKLSTLKNLEYSIVYNFNLLILQKDFDKKFLVESLFEKFNIDDLDWGFLSKKQIETTFNTNYNLLSKNSKFNLENINLLKKKDNRKNLLLYLKKRKAMKKTKNWKTSTIYKKKYKKLKISKKKKRMRKFKKSFTNGNRFNLVKYNFLKNGFFKLNTVSSMNRTNTFILRNDYIKRKIIKRRFFDLYNLNNSKINLVRKQKKNLSFDKSILLKKKETYFNFINKSTSYNIEIKYYKKIFALIDSKIVDRSKSNYSWFSLSQEQNTITHILKTHNLKKNVFYEKLVSKFHKQNTFESKNFFKFFLNFTSKYDLHIVKNKLNLIDSTYYKTFRFITSVFRKDSLLKGIMFENLLKINDSVYLKSVNSFLYDVLYIQHKTHIKYLLKNSVLKMSTFIYIFVLIFLIFLLYKYFYLHLFLSLINAIILLNNFIFVFFYLSNCLNFIFFKKFLKGYHMYFKYFKKNFAEIDDKNYNSIIFFVIFSKLLFSKRYILTMLFSLLCLLLLIFTFF